MTSKIKKFSPSLKAQMKFLPFQSSKRRFKNLSSLRVPTTRASKQDPAWQVQLSVERTNANSTYVLCGSINNVPIRFNLFPFSFALRGSDRGTINTILRSLRKPSRSVQVEIYLRERRRGTAVLSRRIVQRSGSQHHERPLVR